MASIHNAFCSAMELGEVLGITSQHVRRLHDGKVLRRNKHGFRLAESVQAYVRHREEVIKQQCSKTDNGYDLARTDRMRCLAERERLDLRLRSGELIRADSVLMTISLILKTLRDNLRGIPAKLMHKMAGISDPKQVNLEMKNAIDAALRKNERHGLGRKTSTRHQTSQRNDRFTKRRRDRVKRCCRISSPGDDKGGLLQLDHQTSRESFGTFVPKLNLRCRRVSDQGRA
jgi:hypothetical protein